MAQQQQQVDWIVAAEARAERVVAEYLRCWGLRDPSTIAHHCRRWVRRASAAYADRPDDDSSTAICRSAVEIAIADIDRWLDYLAAIVSDQNSSDDDGSAAKKRGLVAVELQGLIDKHPTALLSHDNLPPAMLDQLRRAARSVVPPAQRVAMPLQPLGELPPMLDWKCWTRGAGRLVSTMTGVVSLRWLRQARA